MNLHNKFLIIEDHEIVRWALVAIMDEKFPSTIPHAASTFDQGISLLKQNLMDIIMLDIDVHGGNSPGMINQLRAIQPQVRILIYTSMEEEDYAHKYFLAGADGYLSKKAPFETIAEAFETVIMGKKYISITSQGILAQSYLQNPAKKRKNEYNVTLTVREIEIARLLIDGKWTKEIADQLNIKLSTVSTHKLHIFEKFDVTTVVELYRKAEREMPELLNRYN